MANITSTQRDSTAVARREQSLLANKPSIIVASINAAATATASLGAGPTVDFAESAMFRPNCPQLVSLRGKFGAVGGGSCTGLEIKINSPAGVVLATQRVPFSDVSGFQVDFYFPYPSVSKYWFDYQLVGTGATPSVEITLQEATMICYGTGALEDSFTI